MPSSTAIVLNSRPTPPTSATVSATSAPRLRRWTWPGTNWVNELAMATIGLPKSSSVIPVARQSARAPAMLRPWVDVAERSGRAAPAGAGTAAAALPSARAGDVVEGASVERADVPVERAAVPGERVAPAFLLAPRAAPERGSDACGIRQVWQRDISPQPAGNTRPPG